MECIYCGSLGGHKPECKVYPRNWSSEDVRRATSLARQRNTTAALRDAYFDRLRYDGLGVQQRIGGPGVSKTPPIKERYNLKPRQTERQARFAALAEELNDDE